MTIIRLIYWCYAAGLYSYLALELKQAIEHRLDWPQQQAYIAEWKKYYLELTGGWPFYDGLGN